MFRCSLNKISKKAVNSPDFKIAREDQMRYLITILLTISVLFAETKHLIAPDGSTVTISRDEYGVPHISADNEAALFFGQGFAEANDRLYQIDLNRRAGTGRLSEWFGSLALDFDKDIRRNGYTKAELNTMIGSLSDEVRTAFEGYSAGINAYADTMNQSPNMYKPTQYDDMDFDPITIQDLAAFGVYMLWDFGKFGGHELSRLNELQNNGWDWFNENRPVNDPSCSTTIPGSGQTASQTWHYSGMTIPEEVALEYEARQEYMLQFKKDHGLIYKFGSFATLVSPGFSTTGNALLLGCPQMGAPEYDNPTVTMEVELECPTIHTGGMSVPGMPFVILGHNENVGWTWTSGVSDNVDTYIDSTQSMNFNDGYWHNGGWVDFEVIVDTINMIVGEEIFTHYRTIHGPVVSSYLPLKQVFSHKMTFWMDELLMAEYVYDVNKATSIYEYENALSTASMSFNCFVVDQDQNIGFWHSGRFQDRTDGVHPYLPHKGDGSEEWGGFIDFEDLPQSLNPDLGYFTNWNNKPAPGWNNGDFGPWISGGWICDGVDYITNYVTSFSNMTLEDVKNVPNAISSHGTFQAAYEFNGSDIIDYNINPPGQSDLVHLDGTPSDHKNDQWPLHQEWNFKEMLFGEEIAGTDPDILPNEFKLFAPYPNPFNPITTIRFSVETGHVTTLRVYDITGRLVDELIRGKRAAGEQEIIWNADGLASGVYFVKLESGEKHQTQKLLLLK